jgi:hypothetical protein
MNLDGAGTTRQRRHHRPRRPVSRFGFIISIAAVGLLLASCSPALATTPLKAGAVLTSVNPTGKTVRLILIATYTNNYGGFNFDGYGAGEMTLRIPIGWTVDVTCKNDSTALTQSCAVVDLSISPTGGPIAFAGANTPNPANGLAYGASATFSFVASKIGRYRVACLVSGHEADGMWDWLIVTPGGRPSVSV